MYKQCLEQIGELIKLNFVNIFQQNKLSEESLTPKLGKTIYLQLASFVLLPIVW